MEIDERNESFNLSILAMTWIDNGGSWGRFGVVGLISATVSTEGMLKLQVGTQ